MASREVMNVSIPKAEINITRGEMFSYPTHTHSHYEMTLYEPFDGGITVNGEFFEVKQPSVFLLSPSDFHRITVNKNEPSTFVKIGFYEKVVKSLQRDIPSHPIILENATDHPIIFNLFEEIYNNRDDEEYVTTLISTAMHCVTKYGNAIQPAVSGRRHDLAMKVLRYVNKHFSSDITLTDVAEHFSVSSQYLSTVFTNEIGVGFSTYISDLRLKKAAEMLNYNDKNVTEICFECGYRNLSHFLRSFKQKFGVSPKHYRKQI